METSLFEDIRRRLTLEETVSSKEYLFFLAVAQIPQLKYLQNVVGDCFADRSLLECPQSLQTASKEGYEQALAQFEEFKNKTTEVLQEQLEKDYDNKLFRYKKDQDSLKFQEELFANTSKDIEKFVEYTDFYTKTKEFLADVDKNLEQQREEMKEPVKETVEEYRARITEAYEKGLEEYAKKLEEEKDYTIDGINKFVNKFMEVLDACEEN